MGDNVGLQCMHVSFRSGDESKSSASFSSAVLFRPVYLVVLPVCLRSVHGEQALELICVI